MGKKSSQCKCEKNDDNKYVCSNKCSKLGTKGKPCKKNSDCKPKKSKGLDTNLEFKEKYLKYKNKYLKLKNSK